MFFTPPWKKVDIEWISEGSIENKTVLDLGAGPGILGITAALLGAERVICTYYWVKKVIDIDKRALDIAKRNFEVALGDDFTDVDFYIGDMKQYEIKDILDDEERNLN